MPVCVGFLYMCEQGRSVQNVHFTNEIMRKHVLERIKNESELETKMFLGSRLRKP